MLPVFSLFPCCQERTASITTSRGATLEYLQEPHVADTGETKNAQGYERLLPFGDDPTAEFGVVAAGSRCDLVALEWRLVSQLEVELMRACTTAAIVTARPFGSRST